MDGVEIPTLWRLGEERELLVQIAKDDSRRPPIEGASETPVTVTALEVNESGTLFEWIAGETDLSNVGVDVAALPMLGDLLEGVPKERIVYRVNEFGEFVGVENIEEIRQNVLVSMEVVGEIMALDPSGPPEPVLEDTIALFEGMSDESLSTMFAERAMVYHAFDGYSLVEGQILEGDDLLQNSLGGEPFPAVTSVSHLVERDDQGCEIVQIRTTPDPAEFGRILFDSVGSAFGFDPDESGEAEQAALAEQFELVNSLTLQFDPATETVRQIVAVQEITATGASRVDTTTITDVTAE